MRFYRGRGIGLTGGGGQFNRGGTDTVVRADTMDLGGGGGGYWGGGGGAGETPNF